MWHTVLIFPVNTCYNYQCLKNAVWTILPNDQYLCICCCCYYLAIMLLVWGQWYIFFHECIFHGNNFFSIITTFCSLEIDLEVASVASSALPWFVTKTRPELWYKFILCDWNVRSLRLESHRMVPRSAAVPRSPTGFPASSIILIVSICQLVAPVFDGERCSNL